MNDQAALAETFRLLREVCDPRGHALLDALENVVLAEGALLVSVMGTLRPQPSNVVSMIGRYSTKVPS